MTGYLEAELGLDAARLQTLREQLLEPAALT